MSWNYADLSKAAKAAGGPEKLVEMIANENMKMGKKSMLPWIGLAIGLSSAVTIAIEKTVAHFREKEAASKEALEEAKVKLIQGIKNYDALHPEETEDSHTNGNNGSDFVADA